MCIITDQSSLIGVNKISPLFLNISFRKFNIYNSTSRHITTSSEDFTPSDLRRFPRFGSKVKLSYKNVLQPDFIKGFILSFEQTFIIAYHKEDFVFCAKLLLFTALIPFAVTTEFLKYITRLSKSISMLPGLFLFISRLCPYLDVASGGIGTAPSLKGTVILDTEGFDNPRSSFLSLFDARFVYMSLTGTSFEKYVLYVPVGSVAPDRKTLSYFGRAVVHECGSYYISKRLWDNIVLEINRFPETLEFHDLYDMFIEVQSHFKPYCKQAIPLLHACIERYDSSHLNLHKFRNSGKEGFYALHHREFENFTGLTASLVISFLILFSPEIYITTDDSSPELSSQKCGDVLLDLTNHSKCDAFRCLMSVEVDLSDNDLIPGAKDGVSLRGKREYSTSSRSGNRAFCSIIGCYFRAGFALGSKAVLLQVGGTYKAVGNTGVTFTSKHRRVA